VPFDGYPISMAPAKETGLFFINPGGYKENGFDEFHYKCWRLAATWMQQKSNHKKNQPSLNI
jgi:hypothetical protein